MSVKTVNDPSKQPSVKASLSFVTPLGHTVNVLGVYVIFKKTYFFNPMYIDPSQKIPPPPLPQASLSFPPLQLGTCITCDLTVCHCTLY